MPMFDLAKVKIHVAALSGRVVLARFGKDDRVALDTRDAMNDFLQALCSYAFDGQMPEPGAKASFDFGAANEQFVVTVERLTTAGIAALKENHNEGA